MTRSCVSMVERLGVSVNSIFPLRFEKVVYQPKGQVHPLIKSFDFMVQASGTLIVIGPNGAGKSLFLRLAHGLLKPTSGKISWAQPFAQKNQSMVLQRPVMLRRSVFANLDFALAQKGFSRRKRAEMIEPVLIRLGFEHYPQRSARQLSVGEQQRLAIGRAWLVRPEVMFMDEPTASLDPATTHNIEKLIAEIRHSGTQIIMTTHDLKQAERLADQMMFLHRGRMIEHTPAKVFFTQPESALAAQFLQGELLLDKHKKK